MRSLPDPVPRLRLRGLTKAYGRVRVLDAVDLDVGPGETLLLAGSNGSGKSTLLRCVAGLARCSGEIRFDGQPSRRTPANREALGYLPQAPGLPAWATGAEVLQLFGRLRGAARPSVELPPDFLPPLHRPVGQLSGGQRQRIAIVVALLGAPRLLLLDEPAANLDEEGRDALGQLVGSVRREGTSVVIAAPSPGELGGLADRTVRLVEGKVAAGPYLRTEPGGDVKPWLTAIRGAAG
jgi:ABC-2 type transport system ATP-binding protein